MKEPRIEVRVLLSILLAAVLVVVMDSVIMPILVEFYFRASVALVFAYDFGVVLLSGLAGLFFARRVGLPYWWRPIDGSNDLVRRTYVPVLLGLSIVILNTANSLVNINEALQAAPWITLLTPEGVIALSFRAALNEEILFRFFIFTFVAWASMHFAHSRTISFVIGALVSSIAFGLIHGLGFIWAFFVGLALTYIFCQRGLLPAMIVHFFGVAIPFLLVSMMI